MFEYKGTKYRSKKHPVLEYVFTKLNPKQDITQSIIAFTLRDISEGYRACNLLEPASISNTILDLVRQKRGIESRLPASIYQLGYDLRKRTGRAADGSNYAGEFVYVGQGNELHSWLEWPEKFDREITLSSTAIPRDVQQYLRHDEGALFSVIDYCDVLSQALYNTTGVIRRVQNPMKWQPNEIDGFYIETRLNKPIVYPIEAKALTTRDDVNLEQIQGGLNVVLTKYSNETSLIIVPLAIQMIENGMNIAVFEQCVIGQDHPRIELNSTIKVTFTPPIQSWL